MKRTFLGTVATGASAAEASKNFSRSLLGRSATVELQGFKGQNQDYSLLVSTAGAKNIANPYSGRKNLDLLALDRVAIASAAGLPKDATSLEGEHVKVFFAHCAGCGSTQISDNKFLTKHCVLCSEDLIEKLGDEEDLDNGEEILIDLSELVDIDEEGGEEEGLSNLEGEGYEEDGEEDGEEDEEEDEEEEDEEEEEEEDEEEGLSNLEGEGYEEDEEEDEEDEDVDEDEDVGDILVEDGEEDVAAESDCEEEDSETLVIESFNQAQLEAALAAVKRKAGATYRIDGFKITVSSDEQTVEEISAELESDTSETPVVEDGAQEVVKVEVEEQSDVVDVDLLETVDPEETVVSANVDVFYAASDRINGSRWWAVINDNPVAFATAASAGKNGSIFHDKKFKVAVGKVISQYGVREGLKLMGFQGNKVQMPVSKVLESKVLEAKEAGIKTGEAKLTKFQKNIEGVLSIAAVAINKGFFGNVENPIKLRLHHALTAAGIQNAAEIIDDAFTEAGDEYHEILLDQTRSLLEKEPAAIEQIGEAVANAKYQRANAPSVGAMVANRLANANVPAFNPGAQVTKSTSQIAEGDDAIAASLRAAVRKFSRR